MPPTSRTSPISDLLTSASDSALWHGETVRLIRSATNPSNLDRVSCKWKRHAGISMLLHLAPLQHKCHLSLPCNERTNMNTVTRTQVHTLVLAISKIKDHWKHAHNSAIKKGNGHVKKTDIYTTARHLLWYHTAVSCTSPQALRQTSGGQGTKLTTLRINR